LIDLVIYYSQDVAH